MQDGVPCLKGYNFFHNNCVLHKLLAYISFVYTNVTIINIHFLLFARVLSPKGRQYAYIILLI